MKNITRLLCVGGMALIGLSGCEQMNPDYQKDLKKASEVRNYFAELGGVYAGEASVTLIDFDNDGDMDFIVKAQSINNSKLQFFAFENDGKGNFKLRTYPVDK